MVKRGNLVRVKGHYRTLKGRRVYIKPHTRWAPEKKQIEKMLKSKEQMKEEEETWTDDEVELGKELAYKQGYKGRSIKTSEAIYGRDPKEDEYTISKKALLSLEEKKIIERKDIEKSKKDVELGWKLTRKGKKEFSEEYYDGIEDKD